MNNKIFSLFLLTAILSLNLVLATSFSTSTNSLMFTKPTASQNFILTNTNTANVLNLTVPSLFTMTGESSYTATFSISPNGNVLNLTTQQFTVTNSSAIDFSKFSLLPYTKTFLISNAQDSADNQTITVTLVKPYCDNGNGAAGLSITKLVDEELDNKNSWEWHPLDNVELTVRVSNSAGKDLDMILDYGLYNPNSKQFEDLGSDTIDFSVDDGRSSGDLTINFQVPSDIDEGSDYKFFIKAYDDSNKTRCVDNQVGGGYESYLQTVDIQRESRAVIFNGISLQSPAQCGDSLELKTKVSNIGSSDEKRVLVTLFNKELGINLKEVVESMDSGDEKSITFDFAVPQNATEKIYSLALNTYYKYDSSNSDCNSYEDIGCYDNDAQTDLDKLYNNILLKIEGNCKPITPVVTDNAQITATLDSEAIAGKEMIVRATIKNIGSSSSVYQVLVSGYDSFATLEKEISPSLISLDAGKSQDILIYLKANSAASGDYSFTIKAVSGTKIKEQTVSLSVTPKSSAFGNLNIFGNLRENWFIWVVVLINVVLIILIIVVAVRIARR